MPLKDLHKFSYCQTCNCVMVICGACGNNSCNGMYGEVEGEKCSDCPSAYDMMFSYVPMVEFGDLFPAIDCTNYVIVNSKAEVFVGTFEEGYVLKKIPSNVIPLSLETKLRSCESELLEISRKFKIEDVSNSKALDKICQKLSEVEVYTSAKTYFTSDYLLQSIVRDDSNLEVVVNRELETSSKELCFDDVRNFLLLATKSWLERHSKEDNPLLYARLSKFTQEWAPYLDNLATFP